MSVFHDGTVKEVLDILCAEMDGSLLVRNSDVDLTRQVSIEMKDVTVNDVLASLFGGSDIKWTVVGKQIQIFRPQVQDAARAKNAKRGISGTIVDSDGLPVVGAAVILDENNNIATITDGEGYWTLQVPQSAKSLKVVCLCYLSFSISCTQKS